MLPAPNEPNYGQGDAYVQGNVIIIKFIRRIPLSN